MKYWLVIDDKPMSAQDPEKLSRIWYDRCLRRMNNRKTVSETWLSDVSLYVWSGHFWVRQNVGKWDETALIVA